MDPNEIEKETRKERLLSLRSLLIEITEYLHKGDIENALREAEGVLQVVKCCLEIENKKHPSN